MRGLLSNTIHARVCCEGIAVASNGAFEVAVLIDVAVPLAMESPATMLGCSLIWESDEPLWPELSEEILETAFDSEVSVSHAFDESNLCIPDHSAVGLEEAQSEAREQELGTGHNESEGGCPNDLSQCPLQRGTFLGWLSA
jgi:hypothetical protein